MDAGGPIFIGGTGRSGTSIMARVMASHPDIVLPAHENKLILEKDGLMDLVERLGGRYDIKRNHYAVTGFAAWARKLRSFGFADERLNQQVRELRRNDGLSFQKACEAVARGAPAAELSLHAIGQGFGLAHYDACVSAFMDRIVERVLGEGLVDSEGLIRPFVYARRMDRGAALDACRAFLDSLYSLPLRRAAAVRWCDDTPSNWLYLDFLHELYPDLRFINMVRDTRDAVASFIGQVWAPSDPALVVEMFKGRIAAYRQARARTPPDRVLELRLEDVTAEPERTMDRVAAFLGVENRFDAALFSHERAQPGGYAAKLAPDMVRLVETELGEWMRTYGYLS
jgi:hypothetical protein